MKVWVIGRSYPVPGNNMMGSFELEQAKMLQRNGADVNYLCCSLHPTRVIQARGYRCAVEDGVKVHTYSRRFPPRVYPLYCIQWRNKIWSGFLNRVCKSEGMPDVIHVHYPTMLMIADALRSFHELGAEIFATEHWTKVLTKSLDPIEIRELRKYFGYMDACVCVGKPLAKAVEDLTGEVSKRVLVIPNVVDRDFQPLASEHEGFRFVAVGRLVPVKQFDRIFDAFAQCFRGERATLTIIGNGSEYSALKEAIDARKMGEQIALTGSLPRDQVARYVASADCLVCFSRLETFGVPVIEAWASGIPAITTTAAPVIDEFDERLGIRISPDRTEDLGRAMLHIYHHREDYDKAFISGFAAAHFSERVISERLFALYQKESKHT